VRLFSFLSLPSLSLIDPLSAETVALREQQGEEATEIYQEEAEEEKKAKKEEEQARAAAIPGMRASLLSFSFPSLPRSRSMRRY
jgi:hypothetical protein